MHKEILTNEQIKLLPLVRLFARDFGLVGGTAFALYIGHRESIDFDLFATKQFDNNTIKRKLKNYIIQKIIRDETDQFTLIINNVRFTFFNYPFKISFSEKFNDVIKLPSLLTLSAMKAYALGRRAKWKDYVDLYFATKKYHSIKKITEKAKNIFGHEFNEKIFRAQLAYFRDIDHSEKIIYAKGFKVDDKVIEEYLLKCSLE